MASRHTTPSASGYRPPKPQRILACVLCQQRKVKCDRKFPCNHCIKDKVQCVPAQQMPRRRKRLTEQELTEKLRQYEDLLRRNNIVVELAEDMNTEGAVTDDGAPGSSSTSQAYLDSVANTAEQSSNIKSEDQTLGEVKDFWDAMHQRPPMDVEHGTEKGNVDNNFGNPTFDDLS